ncbi:MAG: hypothetical protein AABY22_07775, partial [Nanoarchaeota archaeon]
MTRNFQKIYIQTHLEFIMVIKKILFFALILLIFSSFASAEVQITKNVISDVIIKEIGNPAVFEFKIKNLGSADDFEFYNFFGFTISPVGTFRIDSALTDVREVKFYAPQKNELNGFYNLEYYIKGEKIEAQKDFINFKIVSLRDVFEIGSENIRSGSNSIKIYIANREPVEIDNVKVKFSSAFFSREEEFSLDKYGRKEFAIELNPEDYKRLVAGNYALKAEIGVGGKKTEQETIIMFVENENIVTNRESSGFFINNLILTKSNEGNVVANVDFLVKKNILTRLFTSFSPEADEVVREGATVYYSWKRELNPAEEFRIVVKTNYFFPLILIIFLILVVATVKIIIRKHVVIRKKVSFVKIKGKGGDFALKVSVIIQAKEFVEKVNVIDRIPSMVKVHEYFPNEKPDHVDEKTGKIVWKFHNLDKGEIRRLSYVVYSKIGVMGKFSLPRAVAIYEKNGDIHESESNRAYFVAEQITAEDID